MVDVMGISNEWERRMRSVKRGISRSMGYIPTFTSVVVSGDIARDIKENTMIIGEVGIDTTFETVPLVVDEELPSNTVLYIWREDQDNG